MTVSFPLAQPLSELDTDARLNLLASFADFLKLPQRITEGKIEITIQKSRPTRAHAHIGRDVTLVPMQ